MPVSQQPWAVAVRERMRRVSQWEPWGRDRKRPDPCAAEAGEEHPDQWDLEDEPQEVLDALKDANRPIRYDERGRRP